MECLVGNFFFCLSLFLSLFFFSSVKCNKWVNQQLLWWLHILSLSSLPFYVCFPHWHELNWLLYDKKDNYMLLGSNLFWLEACFVPWNWLTHNNFVLQMLASCFIYLFICLLLIPIFFSIKKVFNIYFPTSLLYIHIYDFLQSQTF